MRKDLIEDLSNRLSLVAETDATQKEILTPEARHFDANWVQRFTRRHNALLDARVPHQARLDAKDLPEFLPQSAHIHERSWKVAPPPSDVVDRRVETKDEIGESALTEDNDEHAAERLRSIVTRDGFGEFLALPAYDMLTERRHGAMPGELIQHTEGDFDQRQRSCQGPAQASLA